MLRPITSTYRLQLNKEFTLHHARARLPYLKSLGISHLYLSPVLAARAGSTHGYDVADPTHVGAELGGDSAFVALADAAHELGLGIILDIVPNHMGIGPDNPFWDDLLMHGPTSTYAGWFDVEWRATRRTLTGKVLLPVLGDTLANVLARHEIGLHASDRGVRLTYFAHHFPIDPATLPPELELAQRDPAARTLAAEWTEGDAGRARLAELMSHQHYELAFWRTASRDINYRRFFDVNELIALRVEREEVFDATHRVVLQMVADGHVDGLRVDHVDGLLEPGRYLRRLRTAVDARQPATSRDERFPIFVEKILAPGEQLPASWPVEGTTGYEFMVTLEDLFIDPAGHARLEARYARRGMPQPFHEIAVTAKRRVLRGALNADVRRIAPMLATLARRAGWPARSIGACAMAIVELTAALTVYRTYLDAEHPEARPEDRAALERAFATVRERGRTDTGATESLERALLGRWTGDDVDPRLASQRMAFVLRWQQLSGPAAAKGVEDTALYMYAPLASRNEVGGDPGVPVQDAAKRLHALLAHRARHAPRCLNATNTHDTKRSADVRSRLDALSTHAPEWERRLGQWRGHHRDLRSLAGGRLAPTRTTDNFIYQALVGIWPIGGAVSRDADPAASERELAGLRARLTAYIQKAVREAKVSTSWTDPDTRYEEAISRFIAGLLDRGTNGAFLRELDQFVDVILWEGIWTSLARLTIHLTAPGVPDMYQGDELWFQALVDPDNRQPVNWHARQQLLDQCLAGDHGTGADGLKSLKERAMSGALKMEITSKLLLFRRDNAAMMAHGSYLPQQVDGSAEAHLFAFRRDHGAASLIVLVPRLAGSLHRDIPLGDAWGDSRIVADQGSRWRCVLSGNEVTARDGTLPLRDALSALPLAVLHRVR